jgi:hypothetical protein
VILAEATETPAAIFTAFLALALGHAVAAAEAFFALLALGAKPAQAATAVVAAAPGAAVGNTEEGATAIHAKIGVPALTALATAAIRTAVAALATGGARRRATLKGPLATALEGGLPGLLRGEAVGQGEGLHTGPQVVEDEARGEGRPLPALTGVRLALAGLHTPDHGLAIGQVPAAARLAGGVPGAEPAKAPAAIRAADPVAAFGQTGGDTVTVGADLALRAAAVLGTEDAVLALLALPVPADDRVLGGRGVQGVGPRWEGVRQGSQIVHGQQGILARLHWPHRLLPWRIAAGGKQEGQYHDGAQLVRHGKTPGTVSRAL